MNWLKTLVRTKEQGVGQGWADKLLEIQKTPPMVHIGIVIDKINSAMSSRIIVQMPADSNGLHPLVEITERYTNVFDVLKVGHKVGVRWVDDKPEFAGVIDDLTKKEDSIRVTTRPPTKCSCHERDSSQVCAYCYAEGERGHMEKGN